MAAAGVRVVARHRLKRRRPCAAPPVVPERVELAGTLRTFEPATRRALEPRIHEVAAGVAATHRGEATTAWTTGSPVVLNDAAAAVIDALQG